MMVTFMMIIPALSGNNATYANSKVTLASGNWVEIATLLVEALVVIEELFCPETPQNRCKHGKCGQGACISFRPACGTLEDAC